MLANFDIGMEKYIHSERPCIINMKTISAVEKGCSKYIQFGLSSRRYVIDPKLL